MNLPRIRSLGFTTANAEQLAHFYGVNLGCQPGRSLAIEGGRYAELIGLPGSRLMLKQLHLGQEQLELTEVLALGPGLRPGRPVPGDSRSCDLWFQHICVVVANMDDAAAPLQARVATGALRAISTTPQTLPSWNTAAAGIQAYKVHDPEGHCLELLHFPPDKGDARWHQADASASTPFLGIDHSAIANADTPRSCRFYEGLLGLRLGDAPRAAVTTTPRAVPLLRRTENEHHCRARPGKSITISDSCTRPSASAASISASTCWALITTDTCRA